MSRQLEQKIELRRKRLDKQTLSAVNGGLEDAIGRAGGVLVGLSVKLDEYECLVTLRAVFPAGSQVAFVGGEDLGSALRKAVREGKADALGWREDKWGK